MGKILENKKKKKERLLEAAYELFTAEGVENTSISDIARRALVAKGTFYLYFKDKYEIERHLIASKSNEIIASAFKEAMKKKIPSNKENVFFIINYIIDFLASDPKLLTFISKNLSWGVFTEAIFNDSEENVLDYEKLVNVLIYDVRVNDGEINEISDLSKLEFDTSNVKYKDVDIMIYTIFELVSSTCYNIILNEKPTTLKSYKPYLFGLIEAILKQHEI
ncbi:MAG: TetR/AcrR family transcriptional regulator [Eubacterium sp.]|nr:TetR/AcrR family transcriptional regulator [Eubacterium sp.]